MAYEYELYDPAGDLVRRRGGFRIYTLAREAMRREAQSCADESTGFVHRVSGGGRRDEERRFVVKGGVMLEVGLLKPREAAPE